MSGCGVVWATGYSAYCVTLDRQSQDLLIAAAAYRVDHWE